MESNLRNLVNLSWFTDAWREVGKIDKFGSLFYMHVKLLQGNDQLGFIEHLTKWGKLRHSAIHFWSCFDVVLKNKLLNKVN